MANEQSTGTEAPAKGQSRGSEQGHSGKLTGRAESDFDFEAFAESSTRQGEKYEAEAESFKRERMAEEAANRGATLGQPAAEPEPQKTETPEQDGSTEETPRPSDRFSSEDDARQGYDNLMTLQARQAEELGNLRNIAARAEAEKAVRAEMQAAPAAPPQQNAKHDRRTLAYARAVQFQKERYGLDDDEARIAAQEMIGIVDYLASERVEQAAARVRPMVEKFEGEKALQERVNRVALESDNSGQPMRPDWKDVTMSEEFAQVVQSEPDLIHSDLGLRHAYQTAKYMQQASPKAMAKDAAKLKAEASAIVAKEKARAGGSATTTAPDPPREKSEKEEAWDGMFEVDTNRHFMQGGPRRG